MPNVLILCAHRPNRSPSQRYRFEQYLSFLEATGFKFTWSYLLNEEDDRIFYSTGNVFGKISIILRSLSVRRKDVKRFKDFDFIFIQREANFLGSSTFEKKAFLSGAKVIFDFDDSIWLADTSPGNKKWEWIKKSEKFFENIKYAHTIIAGNNYLSDKAVKSLPLEEGFRVRLIPTTVDTATHFPKPELRGREKITIGWSGSISTIKHFELLLPVLKKLKEKYKDTITIKIMGDKNYFNKELDITSVEWTEKTEVDELNTFDIGLMPLPNNEWSKGKCGLKALTYMACGIPVVLSNVGANKEIVENNVSGFLVNTEEEWLNVIEKLIEDPALRKKTGEKGREVVLTKYSVEANKQEYLKIFATK